ncbi:MAG: hypothetical protein U0441_00670 [Polyangiaceae bacterium]
MTKKLTHHLEHDGFSLVFDSSARGLALRFADPAAQPLNAYLDSVSRSPSRLEDAAEKLRRGEDVENGKLRLFFIDSRDRRASGVFYQFLETRWQRAHAKPFEGTALLLEHHKRRRRLSWIAPTTLLTVLDHLRRIGAGDHSSVLSASRYTLRRLRMDGFAVRIRNEKGALSLEFEGAEVDGADILVHHFHGAYGAREFHVEMLRTGGRHPGQAFGYGPIVYPYRDYETNQRFQTMKAAWERARKKPLTEPVWMGGADWESTNHYVPLSTLRRLSDLSRRLAPDLCRHHGDTGIPYTSVEELSIDGFPVKRWHMNTMFHQSKLTLPRHNPINWMRIDLEDRFGSDVGRQLEFLRGGESSPGPGTSFARLDPGHSGLDCVEFAEMKAIWEASTGRRLNEPVWRVQNDWEQETAFIPQSTLERLLA